ncbi:MAG: serine hydrolase domain-containing protein [Saprospiraceae bacterium]
MEKRCFGLIILVFVSLLLKSCSSPQTEEKNPPKKSILTASEQALVDEFTYAVEEQYQLKNAPTGMAVAIVKDGKILLQKGFGLKKAGERDSIDKHTVFRIASLSKGFAAVLAAQVVAEKKLRWNSKVKDYIPNFQLIEDSATQILNLKHVLSHSTGLPRHAYGNLIEAGQSMQQMIPRLKEVPLIAAPGRVMAYQNLAYSLVQPMLEKTTKMTYDSLIKQYIYKPLKMVDASIDYESLMQENNIALPHSSRNSLPMEQQDDYFSVLPAAGVNASIADMAIWVNALLGHHPEVISLKSLKPIYKQNNRLPKNNPWSRNWDGVTSVGYAMGWRTINYKDQKLIYHGGYLNGYRTEMAFCLEEDIGIVVLSNSFSRFLMQSVPTFFDIYNQQKMEKDSMQTNLLEK